MPSCPSSVSNNSRFSSASKVLGSMQRMMICWNRSPLPPLALCWGKSSLGGKPFLSRIVLWQRPPLINQGMLKHGKVVDIDHLDVPLAHAHVSVLQTTARQHCFRLTGELVSCFSMFEGKGEPGANCPSHYTARAKRPMELIHIDTSGPCRHLSGNRGRSGVVFQHVRGQRGTGRQLPITLRRAPRGRWS